MGKITYITGGARSGKSSKALEIGQASGGRLSFIATAQAVDDEMHERIERHKADRGAHWHTVEEPVDIVTALVALEGRFDTVVVDCLTIWLANLMHAGRDIETEASVLVDVLARSPLRSILVSNEVGMGIVPASALAREFRDHAGRLNSTVACNSHEAYLMVSGLAFKLK